MTRGTGGGEGTGIGGKLWQIGKVYRRDQPVMSKGRMREFMQAVSNLMLTIIQLN